MLNFKFIYKVFLFLNLTCTKKIIKESCGISYFVRSFLAKEGLNNPQELGRQSEKEKDKGHLGFAC